MPRDLRLEVILVAAIVLVTAVGVRAIYLPSEPQAQIERVEQRYDLDLGTPNAWFTAWALGDGQAYALIAADPTGRKLDDHVNEAAYRFARAGYGWMSGIIAFGNEPMIPYALAIAGAVAVAGTFALTVYLRPRLGPRAWLIVLNPAVFIAFAGDTSETLGIGLLALAVAASSWVAAVFLGVTQPTFLVTVWGRWRLFLPGVASAALLAGYSFMTFGSDAMIPGSGRLALPFTSYVGHLSFWGVALAVAAVGTIVIGWWSKDWAWVLTGLFVLCFGPDVLREPINAWRVAGFLPVLWAFGPGYVAPVPARSTSAAEPSLTG